MCLLTEKDLKKLNRQELLEVLLAQSKKIDRLQAQLRAAQEKLTERELTISEAGSIAEASLVLNNVFADAQKAADQYLENIRRLHDHAEQQIAESIRMDIQKKVEDSENSLAEAERLRKEAEADRAAAAQSLEDEGADRAGMCRAKKTGGKTDSSQPDPHQKGCSTNDRSLCRRGSEAFGKASGMG